MKKAIGTKVVEFEEMERGEIGSALVSGNRDGYHVRYTNPDGSKYNSWSPKDVFDKSYRALDGGMTFGDAIFFLKEGKKVARKGWNGKNMWIVYTPPFVVEEPNERTRAHGITESLSYGGYIMMMTAQGVWQPGWLASQADMFAEDWVIVD